jgi:hypothetical protein
MPAAGGLNLGYPLPSMSRKDLEALLVYLRENAGLYPMEALRMQIVRAGHSQADADRAIAVFEGKAPRSEPAVWSPALLVALVDLALAFLCYELFSNHGAGKASCSAVALVPGVYLTQLFASVILLAGGKERWGRALLLGFLIFFAVGVLIGFGFFVRWLSKVTGS